MSDNSGLEEMISKWIAWSKNADSDFFLEVGLVV